MTYKIRQSYGKHRVRVSKIKRASGDNPKTALHKFFEAAVDIELEGDFDAAYTVGDNRLVVATDTCRNTVYVLAKDDPIESIETFGQTIAAHFLRQYAHVDHVTVTIRQQLWDRLQNSPHGFSGNDRETPTATVIGKRDTQGVDLRVRSGLCHCIIAKTTESGFENFHKDQYRTLPDTSDRILATSLTAHWDYRCDCAPSEFAPLRESIRTQLMTTFLDHYSRSVQETLYLMAAAVLDRVAAIESISLTMPNKHHIRFNFEPFGMSNDDEVFVVTDEPFGYITATISR
jgi:urate oxidase